MLVWRQHGRCFRPSPGFRSVLMNFPKFVRLPSSLPPTRFFPVSRRNFAVGPGGKPWFVDEDEEEPNGIMSTTPTGSTSLSPPTVPTIIPPPPPSAPSYLAHTYHYLASLPLIDPSTIHIGTPTPAETHPDPNLPLPMLKKVRKARGKKERGYGRGVGEGIGQGVYQWEASSPSFLLFRD